MSYISLLPQSYRKQRQQSLRWAAITLGIAIVVGVLAFAYVFVQGLNQIPAVNMGLLQMEHQANEQKIKDIQSQDVVGEEVSRLSNLVATALGNQPNWLDLLVEIGQSMPEGIQMKGIDSRMVENSGEVVLSGECGNHAIVADWIDVFGNHSGIAGVTCNFSTLSQDTQLVQFEIIIALPPTMAVNWLSGGY